MDSSHRPEKMFQNTEYHNSKPVDSVVCELHVCNSKEIKLENMDS